MDGKYIVGDAEYIPFPDEYFDVVFCCGDVLDYINSEVRALTEMHRVLKPKGLILISVGNRTDLGILWYLVSLFLPGRLRYNLTPYQVGKLIFGHSKNGHKYVEFPHMKKNRSVEYVPIRSYTYYEIKRIFKILNIKMRFYYGFHVITNLLPYTIVSDEKCSQFFRSIARFLVRLDEKIIDKPPFNRLGSHLLFIGEKMLSDS